MANTNAPFGMRPVRYLDGRPYTGHVMRAYIPASDSTAAYFIGDPVTIVGTSTADGVPHVTRATVGTAVTTDRILGCFMGFERDATYDSISRADDTARYCLVTVGEDLLYEMQEDGNMGITATGGTCQIIAGSGNTYTGSSGFLIDSSEAAQTATDQLLIIAPVERPDNDPASSYAKWLVKINMYCYAPGVAGVS